VRDRSFENQCYHASRLNLVVAAIILWTTIHLEKVVAQVSKQREIRDVYLSRHGWEHINLTDDYVGNRDLSA